MNTMLKNVIAAILLLVGFSFAVPVTTCQVISLPGTYDVQNNLTTATGDCIVIQADNVNLNCDAHSISASGASYAVYVTEGSDNVFVDRCQLENSLAGIRAGGDGPDAGSDVTPVTDLTLRNNVALNNAYGYELLTVTGSLIEHNTAWESTRIGFELSTSDGNTLQYNNVWLTMGDINGPQDGFYLKSSSNNRLIGNAARQNAKQGFEIVGESNANILDSNIAEQNDVGFLLAGSGYDVPDGNQFTGNTANDNAFAGIQFLFTGTQNGISGSTVSNNGNGGILVTSSPATVIRSNTLTHNGYVAPTNSGILVFNSVGYVASDNVVDGSPNGIKILNSNMGTLDNNIISNSAYPLLVQDSTSNEIVGNTVENSGPVQLRGDATNTGIMELTIRGSAGEVMVHIPVHDGDYDITVAPAPSSAPSGYTPLGRYVSVAHMGGPSVLLLGIQYEDSDLGSLVESTVTSMLWDGSWSTPAQSLNMASNTVEMTNPGFGTFGLFARPAPVPPTPPSGGGSSGGGTTHGSGGAPHIGIIYGPGVNSSEGTTTVEPSCTSDSDCATSAICSGGVCRALEAGGSCGAFVNHAWVDYDCCGGEDCNAGEVCKNNECVPMEPLDITGTEPQSSGSEAAGSDQGLGRLLADIPWWVLLILVLMVGGGIYARYRMGQSEQPPEGEAPPEEELPPAEPEEE